MTEKPPVPARTFDAWERIPVDTSDESDYQLIRRIAVRAADAWMLGPTGPYKTQQSMADVVAGSVNEALLQLLELGLVDIDAVRLHAAHGYPVRRKDFRE